MNNKMKTTVGCALLVSLLAGTTGCQLAKKEAPQKEITAVDASATPGIGQGDQLCGAYITVREDEQFKQDKIYATEVKGEEGETQYEFKGLSGSAIFYTWNNRTGEDKGYISNTTSGFLDDVAMNVAVNNNENTDANEEVLNTTNNTIELTGTLKVINKTEIIVDVYGVYKQKDGKVYILRDSVQGSCLGGGSGELTQTLKESYNETINGKEEVTGCVVKLTVQPIDEAESVVVKQMNGKDQVIASTTYKKKDFNEKTGNVNVSEYEEKTLKLQKATEYLIVEEHVIDEEKNKKVNRSIVVYDAEEEDNEIACNFANKDGVIDTRLVNLVK